MADLDSTTRPRLSPAKVRRHKGIGPRVLFDFVGRSAERHKARIRLNKWRCSQGYAEGFGPTVEDAERDLERMLHFYEQHRKRNHQPTKDEDAEPQ